MNIVEAVAKQAKVEEPQAISIIENGYVFINGENITDPNHIITIGDTWWVVGDIDVFRGFERE